MKSFFPSYRFCSGDKSIWNDVYYHDEYNLPRLTPSDVVIDVGAHTGAFTCACLNRGARRIIAFEPDPDSFALAMENIQDYLNSLELAASVEVYNSAVWRSDRQDILRITKTRFSALTNSYHHGAQSVLFNDKDTTPVHSVALDNILRPLGKVSLVKLNCEGAEWPILFTSTQLGKVTRLLFGIHSLTWKAYELGRRIPPELFAEFGHSTFEDLKTHLQEFGLRCVREQIEGNFLNDPDFYFGKVAFECRGNLEDNPRSLTGRLEWYADDGQEILIRSNKSLY